MTGKKALAIRSLTDRIQTTDPSESYYLTYLFAGLAFTHLLSGELNQAGLQAQQVQLLAEKSNASNSAAWGCYLQACVHLHTYDLDRAADHFVEAARQRYILGTQAEVDALIGLALTLQLRQQPDEAGLAMDRLMALAGQTNDRYTLSAVQSGQARLALLSGDLTAAVKWVHTVSETPVAAAALFLWVEVPCLTQARVLIAIGSRKSLNQAAALLLTIRRTSDACRFTNQTIEAAVLQSLVQAKQGRTDDAMVTLDEALSLTGPGEWIRPFVEAGPAMVELLKRLQRRNPSAGRIGTLLAVLEKTVPEFVQQAPGRDRREAQKDSLPPPDDSSPTPLIEPLTNREMDVLELLDRRMQNKEIADKLCISPQTVASHLKNIYQKIGVNNRLKAVQAARRLKIF